jgi:hypothetical protein
MKALFVPTKPVLHPFSNLSLNPSNICANFGTTVRKISLAKVQLWYTDTLDTNIHNVGSELTADTQSDLQTGVLENDVQIHSINLHYTPYYRCAADTSCVPLSGYQDLEEPGEWWCVHGSVTCMTSDTHILLWVSDDMYIIN